MIDSVLTTDKVREFVPCVGTDAMVALALGWRIVPQRVQVEWEHPRHGGIGWSRFTNPRGAPDYLPPYTSDWSEGGPLLVWLSMTCGLTLVSTEDGHPVIASIEENGKVEVVTHGEYGDDATQDEEALLAVARATVIVGMDDEEVGTILRGEYRRVMFGED